MKKYQLSISIRKAADQHSAATKAVQDCNTIFSEFGYDDYNLAFPEGMGPLRYYGSVFLKLLKFYFKLERNAIVAVQYPMLNNVFKYFIKAAAVKKVRFFCIVHDIESLRLGGTNNVQVRRETSNLNFYDYLIVHNEIMLLWMQRNGVASPMHSLKLFDYLSKSALTRGNGFTKKIVYAGNLAKSRFIYKLNLIDEWDFNLYGPNYDEDAAEYGNVKWCGSFSPGQIVNELNGSFGLIWDGDSIDEADALWGNYLRYNNPHKFSLYLAAGLPVIAPRDSAIGKLIVEQHIGLLVDNLHNLQTTNVMPEAYNLMKQNCLKLSTQVASGHFFREAVKIVEDKLRPLKAI